MSETIILQKMDFESSESSEDIIIPEDISSGRLNNVKALLVRLFVNKYLLQKYKQQYYSTKKVLQWIDFNSSTISPSKIDTEIKSSNEYLEDNSIDTKVIIEQDIHVEVPPESEYVIEVDSIEFEKGEPVIIDQE